MQNLRFSGEPLKYDFFIERILTMKKIAVSLLAAVMAVSLFAAEPESGNVNVDKRIAELQAERQDVQKELIKMRRNAIRYDKYAAKLAKEILTLNRQLSEYLDTKAEIKELNRDLGRIDRELRKMKQMKSEKKDSK